MEDGLAMALMLAWFLLSLSDGLLHTLVNTQLKFARQKPPGPVSLHLRKKDNVLVSSEFNLVSKNAFSRGLSVSAGCATAKL